MVKELNEGSQHLYVLFLDIGAVRINPSLDKSDSWLIMTTLAWNTTVVLVENFVLINCSNVFMLHV